MSARPPAWSLVSVVIVAVVVFGLLIRRTDAPPKPSDAPAAQHARVSMKNFAFEPSQITVPVGTTVDWIDVEGKHGVTFDDAGRPGDASDTIDVGGSESRTFQTPGNYFYHCPVHGGAGGRGMYGVVIVRAQ